MEFTEFALVEKKKKVAAMAAAWSVIQETVLESGAVSIYSQDITKDVRDTLSTSVYIELNQGDFAGEWLFPHAGYAIICLSSRAIIKALLQFDQTDYLISIHDATGH